MKKLCILSCVAAIASLSAADEPPAKPGFWKRAWGRTRDGAESVWDATKTVGKKTADVVTAPLSRKGGKDAVGATEWRNLAMSVKVEPAKVRLPETRAIEVTVSVVNNGKSAVHLEFPTSLRVDVVLKDESGKIISRWSDDQRIEKEPGILLINPKERLEYSAKVSTREMIVGRPFEIEAYFPSYERLRARRMIVPEK
jgi:hypothetical protein